MKALKEDFEKSGGEWKEYKIGDLFVISTPKKKFNANAVKFGTKYPYVVRTSLNNGIRAALDEDEEFLNDGNTISFGQDTATIFYQEKPYFTGDKIKVMKFLPCELNSRIACYLLSVMRKAFSTFSWGTTSFNENILSEVSIELPVHNGEIAFSFMESCIRELEEERIRELEEERIRELTAYLKVVGLDNYTIIRGGVEDRALTDFRNGKIVWKEFKIGELFNIEKGKRLTKENMKPGNINFLGAISINNGIREKISTDVVWKPNCITVNYNGSVGYSFYQEEKFYASDDVNVCYAKNWNLDREIALFFCSVLFKYSQKFSYTQKWTKERMECSVIRVPVTSNNEIDFDFMQNFITAQEKLAINGVVEWKDKIIDTTKVVVYGNKD